MPVNRVPQPQHEDEEREEKIRKGIKRKRLAVIIKTGKALTSLQYLLRDNGI